MVMAYFLMMVISMMDNGIMDTFMEWVSTNGKMEKRIPANGCKANVTELEFLLVKTAASNMMDNGSKE